MAHQEAHVGANTAGGVEVMPWRLEDVLRARGANYIRVGLFKAFEVEGTRP